MQADRRAAPRVVPSASATDNFPKARDGVHRVKGYDSMTLTTFQDVPFNGPFFESLGWRVVKPVDLSPGLAAARRAEADAGLDAGPRQAMAKQV